MLDDTKPNTVIKDGGHCYDGCGWFSCAFWKRSSEGVHTCALFGGAEKLASKALNVCNKVYGQHYEGLP